MNLRQHVKFLTFISVVSIISIVGTIILTQDTSLGVFVSLAADAIQIALYGMWLFQKKEVDLSKVPEQVEEIRTVVTEEREETRVTAEIVSRLVREGAITENELLSLVRSKEIILAFPYAEGLAGKVWQITKGQPLARLLSQVGFVRVALQQNLMVIMADSLPRQLRDIEKLNAFIKLRLPREWERISDKVKERYPEDRYKILERWRTRAAFKVSYILARSMAQDFLIDYIAKNSFTTEFQKHIAGRIDRNQLKKMLKLRRRKVKEIVSRISIEFLLSDIPRDARELIIKTEDETKKALSVKTITDYRLLESSKIADALSKLMPEIEEALIREYSTRIVDESQKCYESLRKLGIDIT